LVCNHHLVEKYLFWFFIFLVFWAEAEKGMEQQEVFHEHKLVRWPLLLLAVILGGLALIKQQLDLRKFHKFEQLDYQKDQYYG
jgi:hypothetical protein